MFFRSMASRGRVAARHGHGGLLQHVVVAEQRCISIRSSATRASTARPAGSGRRTSTASISTDPVLFPQVAARDDRARARQQPDARARDGGVLVSDRAAQGVPEVPDARIAQADAEDRHRARSIAGATRGARVRATARSCGATSARLRSGAGSRPRSRVSGSMRIRCRRRTCASRSRRRRRRRARWMASGMAARRGACGSRRMKRASGRTSRRRRRRRRAGTAGASGGGGRCAADGCGSARAHGPFHGWVRRSVRRDSSSTGPCVSRRTSASWSMPMGRRSSGWRTRRGTPRCSRRGDEWSAVSARTCASAVHGGAVGDDAVAGVAGGGSSEGARVQRDASGSPIDPGVLPASRRAVDVAQRGGAAGRAGVAVGDRRRIGSER